MSVFAPFASRAPCSHPLLAVWHERYHGRAHPFFQVSLSSSGARLTTSHLRRSAVLSMAAYGDWETLCPLTFTQASLLKSYPNSVEAPWTVLSSWGPTASGLQGFNVMIPGARFSAALCEGRKVSGTDGFGWWALCARRDGQDHHGLHWRVRLGTIVRPATRACELQTVMHTS